MENTVYYKKQHVTFFDDLKDEGREIYFQVKGSEGLCYFMFFNEAEIDDFINRLNEAKELLK